MKRTIRYIVSNEECAGIHAAGYESITAGTFLRSKGYSRHIISELKQITGRITLNGAACKVYQIVYPGDVIEVQMVEYPKTVSDNVEATPKMPPIVYEDEDILVVNKPAGMPVHQSHGHYGDTLADAVNRYYAQNNSPIVYRCINRLDRDTTGLLIIAKNMLSGAVLSSDMKLRKIKRTYLAEVQGEVKDPGTVSLPIGRLQGSALRRCIDKEAGETAVTHFHPLQYDKQNNRTLLKVQLETGRTHQIRVHMTAIGHPLCGDFLYTNEIQVNKNFREHEHSAHNNEASQSSTCGRERQALHSYRLQFSHPVTGCIMDLHADLPADMKF